MTVSLPPAMVRQSEAVVVVAGNSPSLLDNLPKQKLARYRRER